ncbi:MAG: hypothetical protein KJ626_04210 [Verrucomicrobia bacterium]|nr:hypothetical protein [Verrucomicrobiota bacterium]
MRFRFRFVLPGVALCALLLSPAYAWDNWRSRTDDDPGFTYTESPADWRTVNLYEILTDRFNNGDTGNDNWQGYYNGSDGQMYHGGDFAGIQAKLDYLQTLGVKAIWISPVAVNIDHTSDIYGANYAPYHGYQPIGLARMNGYFGDLTALRSLVDAAHARGIYVVFDIVINHMADLMGSQNGDNSVYHVTEYGDPWWHHGYQHDAPFNDLNKFHKNGAIENYEDSNQYIRGELNGGLDDLRTEDSGVRADLASIYKALISATDCDGYRIDAVKHIAQDFYDYFLPEIYNHASSLGKTNFICFGEVFSGDDSFVGQFTGSTRHNSMLNFPMMDTMENVFAYGWSTDNLTTRINALSNYHQDSRYQLVNFLDNHDENRFLASSKLNGDADMLKVALTFMYTSLQIPCLYYGTEQGFNGGDDPWNREDMWDGGFEFGPSDGDNFNTNHTLFAYVQRLNQFREQHPALTTGTFTQRWQTTSGAGIYAYSKHSGADEAIVVLNTAGSSHACSPTVQGAPGTTYANLFNPADTLVADGSQTISVSMGAKSAKIYVPSGTDSEVEFDPASPNGCGDVTITYHPNDGPLSTATQVFVFVGHDGWLDVVNPHPAMTEFDSNTWTYVYSPSNGAELINVVFNDGDGTWDNNDSTDWSVSVANCTDTIMLAMSSPVVATNAGTMNGVGDAFDLSRNGGSANTKYQGGFGTFGRVYANYDETNLYLGAFSCDVAGTNNAMILFLGTDAFEYDWAMVDNLWAVTGPGGEPRGIDQLHNVAFASPMALAILLGDEWGDDHWRDFTLENGYSFGQGVYFINEGGPYGNMAAMTAATISQFDGDGESATSSDNDDGNRSMDRWEVRIPWSELGASNGIFSVSDLYIGGLIVNSETNGNDRYISGNYLGETASSDTGLDAYNNFGFSFVTLTPLRIGLPDPDSDTDGIRDGWEMDNFGNLTTADGTSDWDDDGAGDVHEAGAGTNPKDASSVFKAQSMVGGDGLVVIKWQSVDGKVYSIYSATDLVADNFTPLASGIGATPPENAYTDTVGDACGVYKIRVE